MDESVSLRLEGTTCLFLSVSSEKAGYVCFLFLSLENLLSVSVSYCLPQYSTVSFLKAGFVCKSIS